MIKQPRQRYQAVFATAHRVFVYASIGFTALTTAFLGVTFYQHFTNRKAIQANLQSPPLPESEQPNPEDLTGK